MMITLMELDAPKVGVPPQDGGLTPKANRATGMAARQRGNLATRLEARGRLELGHRNGGNTREGATQQSK